MYYIIKKKYILYYFFKKYICCNTSFNYHIKVIKLYIIILHIFTYCISLDFYYKVSITHFLTKV